MAVNGFAGNEHLAEDGKGVREQIERHIGSDKDIEEEGWSTSGEGEEHVGFVQLGTGGIG